MNYLDWILIVILALAAARGYRRGLLRAITGLAGLLLGFYLALAYAAPIARAMDNQYLIEARITAWLLDRFPALGQLAQSGQEGITASLYQAALTAMPGGASIDGISGAIGNLGHLVWVTAVFILLMLIIGLLIRLLSWTITRGISGTIIGSVNRFGGAIVASLTLAVGFGLALTLFAPLLAASGGGGVSAAIDTSLLAPKLIYLFQFVIERLMLT